MNGLVEESANLGSLTPDDLRRPMVEERSQQAPDSPTLDVV